MPIITVNAIITREASSRYVISTISFLNGRTDVTHIELMKTTASTYIAWFCVVLKAMINPRIGVFEHPGVLLVDAPNGKSC
jgi:hypothetical protein